MALRLLAKQYIPADAKVLELGGRYGMVTCAIAAQLQNSGNLVTVEPDAMVWNALEQNLATHHCRAGIVHGAITGKPISITHAGNGNYGTHVKHDTKGSIPITSLAAVESSYHLTLTRFSSIAKAVPLASWRSSPK